MPVLLLKIQKNGTQRAVCQMRAPVGARLWPVARGAEGLQTVPFPSLEWAKSVAECLVSGALLAAASSLQACLPEGRQNLSRFRFHS